MSDKSKLWWASIGGQRCEPIRVIHNCWYSIGCKDEHPLTEAVELVEEIKDEDLPLNKKEEKKQERLWAKEVKRSRNRFSYRKFDQ